MGSRSLRVTTGKTALDDEPYDDVREQTDGFNDGLVQTARSKTAEAYKNVVARWTQGTKASKPTFTSSDVVCDHRTAILQDDYISLATTPERIEADYVLPGEGSDTPHLEYLFSDEYETTGVGTPLPRRRVSASPPLRDGAGARHVEQGSR